VIFNSILKQCSANISHTQIKPIKSIFFHETDYASYKLLPSALDCNHLRILLTSLSPSTLNKFIFNCF
jgi:hypothetical protein